MRLATFARHGVARLGAVVGERVVDLAALAAACGRHLPDNMLAFIDDAEGNLALAGELLAAAGEREGYPLAEVRLLAPIPRPRQNVIAVGRNYREHAREILRAQGEAAAFPEHPLFFTKRATAVIGPEEPILWQPSVSDAFDREVELVVVFGRRGRNIPRERAYDYVFGYTCADDVAARDVQLRKHGGQWFKGASLDNSCPLGPWLVTRDELPNPHDLRLTCRVNGVLKQDASTSQMVFDIPALIEELSAGMTLEPGDVLLTGAPAGAGIGFDPPEFLRAGDVIEVAIEGIGTLRNPVVEG